MDDASTPQDEREEALRLFQEEAYLLSTLRDPHVPAAHFESERGVWLACPICGLSFKGTRHCPDHGSELMVVRERYYLLMDFLDGLDLEQVAEANGGRPLDEAHVLEWMLQVSSALEAVHAKGFSHRDIKPANIKIQKDSPGTSPHASTSSASSASTAPAFSFADSSGSQGGAQPAVIEGRAMLIDFGLVKPSATAGKYGTMVLGRGPALGSSGYAPTSSEELASPDTRTDILALGMTMYRLLSGRDPSEPEDLEAMRKGKPRDFNPSLSSMAEQIILRASAPDRAARYPDVRSLRSDLLAARYPIETLCPHCSHLQRSLAAPDASTRCERCGRLLLSAGAASTSTAPASGTGVARPSSAQQAAGAANQPAQGTAPAWKKGPGADPRAARIDEIRVILGRLSQPASTAGSSGVGTAESRALRARQGEISALLARASKFAPGTPGDCPLCSQRSLKYVTGAGDGTCPLCRKARMAARDNSILTCPVCREGSLPEFGLRRGELFCPICREVPLSLDERRALFGLVADDRWACSHCHAEWDLHGSEAILESAPSDPFGVAGQFMGQSLSVSRWKSMPGRNDHWFACDHCSAQFEARPDDALALMHVEADPFGVGQSFKGAGPAPRRLGPPGPWPER